MLFRSLDQEYVARLAAYVDERIRVAADASPSGDSLRLAVLAALNIADELFRCREAGRQRLCTAGRPMLTRSSTAKPWRR